MSRASPSPTWWLGWTSLMRLSPTCLCEHSGTTSWGPVHWTLLPAPGCERGVEGGLQCVRWGQSPPCPAASPLPVPPAVPSVFSAHHSAHHGLVGAAHSPPYFAACETKASHVCTPSGSGQVAVTPLLSPQGAAFSRDCPGGWWRVGTMGGGSSCHLPREPGAHVQLETWRELVSLGGGVEAHF